MTIETQGFMCMSSILSRFLSRLCTASMFGVACVQTPPLNRRQSTSMTRKINISISFWQIALLLIVIALIIWWWFDHKISLIDAQIDIMQNN